MINTVLETEGGYVNHPNDGGGPTKFGITQKTLSEWRGYWASVQEIKDLTQEEAKQIYEEKYFLGPKLHRLPESVQLFIFDCSINHGPSRAVKFLQKALNKLKVAHLKVDGINGPRTRKAAEKGGEKLKEQLIIERIKFYCLIRCGDASQQVFMDGWIKRTIGFIK